jgi:hypothetical protein
MTFTARENLKLENQLYKVRTVSSKFCKKFLFTEIEVILALISAISAAALSIFTINFETTIFLDSIKFCVCLRRSTVHILKGQSHEKVGEMSAWGISLGPN